MTVLLFYKIQHTNGNGTPNNSVHEVKLLPTRSKSDSDIYLNIDFIKLAYVASKCN